MKAIWNWIKSLFGIGSSSPSGKVAFTTDFLRGWNGGNCPLFLFSEKTTDDQAKSCCAWLHAGGYRVINPYFWCDKDGDGKHPVNVLSNQETVKRRIKYCHGAGLKIVPILFSDDSKAITSKRVDDLTAMVRSALTTHKKDIAMVCVALEPKDSFSDNTVNTLGNAVKAMGFRTGIHTNPVMSSSGKFNQNEMRFARQSWCDFILLQTSFPGSPVSASVMKLAVHSAQNAAPGKKIVAFEYAFDRASLGDVAIEAGAHGIGNEASRGAMEKLPKWV